MNNLKMLSIIIPVYNSEKYIHKCLESVLRQSEYSFNYEIILIDDGSTDRTNIILKNFANNHENITLITQSNQKQGAARNRGLEIATGKYIWFVDSDDWIKLDAFLLIEKYISQYPQVDLIRFGASEIDARGNIKQRENKHNYYTVYKNMDILREDKFNVNSPFHLIKKSFLDENNIQFMEGVYYEDNEFFFKIFLKPHLFVSVPDILYYVRLSESSTTRSSNYTRIFDNILVIDKMVSDVKHVELDVALRISISNLFMRKINAVLFSLLNSPKLFKEAISKIKDIDDLTSYTIDYGTSKIHKFQMKFIDWPYLLWLIMKVFYLKQNKSY